MAQQQMVQTKLAIDGGKPIRTDFLPYARQKVEEEDIQAVVSSLRGEIITRGPLVEAFERAIADSVEMPHAVAFSSATAALHAAAAAAHVMGGTRVITTPNTFAATSNAVMYCMGRPEFIDVDRKTLNLDASKIKDFDRIQSIITVDFAGNPCEYDDFLAITRKYRKLLISDASHSLGAFYHGKPVGSQADMTVFSFHPVKPITTGEGGIVVTRDPELAKYLQMFRGHGIVRTKIPGFYRQEILGYNYNLTDFQAALGLSQLKRNDAMIARRAALAAAYDEYFQKTLGDYVETPTLTKNSKSSWHLYPLRLRLERLTVERVQFLRALQGENIGANVHYIPVYWHPFYEKMDYERGLCPIYEYEYMREISLPLFASMTDQDLRDVCLAIEKLVSVYSKS